MAELNSNEEPKLLPPKRKQPSQTLDNDTKKLRPDDEPLAAVEEKIVNENGENEEIKDAIEDEEEEEDYEGEEEVDSEDEEEDDDDDTDDEHLNGGDEVDRKGKGIMKEDKGKGKMIEESEDDDDDDDSSDEDGDGGGGGGGESDGDDDDFSDDPLAEVDLDNILPSRTRRRTAPKGVRIAGDEGSNDKENDA